MYSIGTDSDFDRCVRAALIAAAAEDVRIGIIVWRGCHL